MHDGHENLYVSCLLRRNELIPGKYAITAQSFWCSIEGEARGPVYELENVNFLTADPACTVSWMPYTSNAPFPAEAVIGGQLADGTDLYVVYVDDGIHRSAYGYYNPRSKVAHYEIFGNQTATTMYLLMVL